VAGDHRTRRLKEDSSPGQRTLDPATLPAETSPPAEPPDLLEAPPPQHSSAQLEERQKRWFRLREEAIQRTENVSDSPPDSGENSPSDPKG
jgi:hypothetical protein